MQQFLCTGPKTGTNEFFREHLHAHESYFAEYGASFIFRGPIRSADGGDNIGTALLLELPDRAAADKASRNGDGGLRAFGANPPYALSCGDSGDTLSKLIRLASYIGSRNYVTFAEIQQNLGICTAEAIALKPELETFMRLDITCHMALNPPGFFLEDR